MGDIVTWYDSAAAVNAAYMRSLSEACGDSLDGATWGGVDADGNEVEVDPADMLHGIETQGMWGFCDGQRIHAWIAPQVDEVKAVGFMAHELAHLRGADAPPIAAEEEAWAELVRGIAEEAVTLVRTREPLPTRTAGVGVSDLRFVEVCAFNGMLPSAVTVLRRLGSGGRIRGSEDRDALAWLASRLQWAMDQETAASEGASASRDDDTCTGCNGTGYNPTRERPCDCRPTTPTRGSDE